jgi:hypothetical protein
LSRAYTCSARLARGGGRAPSSLISCMSFMPASCGTWRGSSREGRPRS